MPSAFNFAVSPFDCLDHEERQLVRDHLDIAYFRAGEVVLHDTTALRRAERMRADFVANASHELKTPIAGLAGFIETLRVHAKEDPGARDIVVMDEL